MVFLKIIYLTFYSGMRRDINILIYLDVKKALEGSLLYEFAFFFFLFLYVSILKIVNLILFLFCQME